jgi:hypothetical protein
MREGRGSLFMTFSGFIGVAKGKVGTAGP